MSRRKSLIRGNLDDSNFGRICKIRREKIGMNPEEVDAKADLYPGATEDTEAGKCKGFTESELKRYAKILGFAFGEFKRWYLQEYYLNPEDKKNNNNGTSPK